MVLVLEPAGILSVICNGICTISVFALALKLATFMWIKLKVTITISLKLLHSCQLNCVPFVQAVKSFGACVNDKKTKHETVTLTLTSLVLTLILLYGTNHIISFVAICTEDNSAIVVIQLVVLILITVAASATAYAAWTLGATNRDKYTNINIPSNAKEAMDWIQDSVVILTDGLSITHSNAAARNMLGDTQPHTSYVHLVHTADRPTFSAAANRVLHSTINASETIEYRIRSDAHQELDRLIPEDPRTSPMVPLHRPGGSSKVCAAEEESTVFIPLEAQLDIEFGAHSLSTDDLDAYYPDNGYVWVATTIHKNKLEGPSTSTTSSITLITRALEMHTCIHRSNKARVTEERARVNAAKLHYISSVAHDLKTPLQSFCLCLDLLLQASLPAAQMECVQQASVAVDLMKLTISQTMDISKALTGAKLAPRCTTVDLHRVVRRVETIIKGFGCQVPIVIHVASDIAPKIVTDEEWLWQMMLNLLANACKNTFSGEIRLELSLRRGTAPTESAQLFVQVTDTGVGVSQSKLSGLFDAFSVGPDGQMTGTGLGLFGVRTRAKGLLGTCGARHNTESVTGTGLVVWFAIPYTPFTSVVRAEKDVFLRSMSQTIVRQFSALYSTVDHPFMSIASSPHAGTVEMITNTSKRHLSAIVIDDTQTVCKLLRRLLLKLGFEKVDCYENGSKGLDAMLAAPVDVVFSDVQMPIMSGPEMVRRFRKFESNALHNGTRSHIQLIVAVTANGAEQSGIHECGFDEILPKPVSALEIQNIMEKYMIA